MSHKKQIPNTVKMFGYYRLKWLGQETTIGYIQSAFQGTPISTCLSVVGTTSACQWAEGRGNFVQFHRDSVTGNLVKDGVIHDDRTDPFFQSDFSFRNSFHVSKDHENRLMTFEADIFSLLNQHSVLAVQEIPFAGGGLISPVRPGAPRFAGDPGTDWAKLMTGYDYVAAANGGNGNAKLTMASRYGLPTVFQGARNMRLAVKLTF